MFRIPTQAQNGSTIYFVIMYNDARKRMEIDNEEENALTMPICLLA